MEDAAAAEKAKGTSTGARRQRNRCCGANTSFRSFWPASSWPATQATGVNSIIGNTAPRSYIQAGLSDVQAHWGYVILTSVNFLLTMLGVMLVDRKGRKFLLSLGSAGIIFHLICTAAMVFHQTEKQRVDCSETRSKA